MCLYSTCLSSQGQVGIAHSSGCRASPTFPWDSAHFRSLLALPFWWLKALWKSATPSRHPGSVRCCKEEEANLLDINHLSPGGKNSSWSASEPSVSHVASWKTQLVCDSSGEAGSTGQLKRIRGFWKVISASESHKYDSLRVRHTCKSNQRWQFNLHALGLWKNCYAEPTK